MRWNRKKKVLGLVLLFVALKKRWFTILFNKLRGEWLDSFFSWVSYRGNQHFSIEGFGDLNNSLSLALQFLSPHRCLSDAACVYARSNGDKKNNNNNQDKKDIGGVEDVEVRWNTEGGSSSWRKVKGKNIIIHEGHFLSPAAPFLPEACQTAFFRFVLPSCIGDGVDLSGGIEDDQVLLAAVKAQVPVTVVLAASGQEGYDDRSMKVSFPLAEEENIGSIVLENPMYGKRSIPKPSHLTNHTTTSVSELILKGGACIADARVLLVWLRKLGFEKVGVCGLSMGAEMSSIAGCCVDFPVAIVPFLPVHSASAVWTEGVMSCRCDWKKLAAELSQNPFSVFSFCSSLSSSSPSSSSSSSSSSSPDGFSHSSVSSSSQTQEDKERGALALVANMLDLVTDIRQFPPPVCPEACVIVGARHDGYIPRDSTLKLHKHWHKSTIEW
eukprot:CAMPEP_0201515636 /NCGR_PEP_ID=MMETSP0161_2-20130828/7135_1 /ASSEMBLY_ACC=CAM_ASM_000251 /TAXON_ID=180227 /ORGANISM="Neoparamoeba aestuarina, Strain SoJaBio B1-5/56/2" /LENGTH=439 /DNA_ID=CAMNT_0047912511 /DNA_START=52 /DNA_END=1368 /DNA_ORIENTATION=+